MKAHMYLLELFFLILVHDIFDIFRMPRVDFDVPYSQRENAKEQGLKWDRRRRMWHIDSYDISDLCVFDWWNIILHTVYDDKDYVKERGGVWCPRLKKWAGNAHEFKGTRFIPEWLAAYLDNPPPGIYKGGGEDSAAEDKAAKGDDGAGEDDGDLKNVAKCPNGHPLVEFVTHHHNFGCDECDASQPLGARLLGCRACNYDVCTKCDDTEAKASALSALHLWCQSALAEVKAEADVDEKVKVEAYTKPEAEVKPEADATENTKMWPMFARLKHKRRRLSNVDRDAIASHQQWKCKYCRDLLPAGYQIDHIISLAQGGVDDISNLQAVCANCHHIKTRVESNIRERLPKMRMVAA